jgi:hypothetical protein
MTATDFVCSLPTRYTHGRLAESFEAGDGGGEGEECEEVVGFAFVADGESSVSGEPQDSSFDHPAVPAELLAGLDTFAGDPDRIPRRRSQTRSSVWS